MSTLISTPFFEILNNNLDRQETRNIIQTYNNEEFDPGSG